MKKFVALAFLAFCIGYTLLTGALAAYTRVLEGAALACARASYGTDAAIAQCYTDRGLPVPDDVL